MTTLIPVSSLTAPYFQGPISNTDPTVEATIPELIAGIRETTGDLKSRILYIRDRYADEDLFACEESKKQLGCIVFSGRFSRRHHTACTDYNGVVIADIDHIEDAAAGAERLRGQPHILFTFISPKGNGLKVGVLTNATRVEQHKAAWATVRNHIGSIYNLELDASGSDVCRACFVSYDPNAWHAEAVEPLLVDTSIVMAIEEAQLSPMLSNRLIPPGHRHQWVLSQTRWLRTAGWSVEDTVDATCWRAQKTLDLSDGRVVDRGEIQRAAEGVTEVGNEALTAHGASIVSAWRSEAEGGELRTECAVDLVSQHDAYRAFLVDGLLREGEVLNLIAAPKIGKSWLVLQLLLAVANGKLFLGRATAQGPVLLVDNELHRETLAQRLSAVSKATQMPLDRVHVLSLRGRLKDLDQLRGDIERESCRVGAKLIALDAMYRLIPGDVSENDNSGMMQLYNTMDRLAANTGAALSAVHHSSKGNQADKGVTDGGAGAGAISRAADTHLYLREHECPGHVCVDAVARSWPQPQPFVIWKPNGTLWEIAEGADPSKKKGARPSRQTAAVSDVSTAVLDAVGPQPVGVNEIRARLDKAGVPAGRDRVEGVLAVLVSDGALYQARGERNVRIYASEPIHAAPLKGEVVARYCQEHPEAPTQSVATACGCSDRLVRDVRRGLGVAQGAA